MTGSYLNTIDYTIIVAYVLALISFGLYLKKKATSSLEDYLVGGRSIPWWMLGVSGMSHFLDVTGTMIIVSFLFMLGPRGLFIEFRGGAVIVLVTMMLWTGKWHRRSGCLTGAEWMVYRFGDGAGGRFAQFAKAISGIITTLGMLAYLVKGIGLFLSMFLPFSPAQCALGMFAIATIYTMFSGFYGVVVTDLFQAAIIVISAITITVLAVGQLTDIDSLSELAMSVTGNPQWTAAVPQLHTPMPQGYEQYETLMLFACLYVLRNLIFGLGAGDDPKYFGARSDSECSKLSFLWTCLMSVRWPMMMGFAVLGLVLVGRLFPDPDVFLQVTALVQQHLPTSENDWATVVSSITSDPMSQPAGLIVGLKDLLGDDWQSKLLLVGFHGTVNPERIMPAVLLYDVPQGFRGLMLVALVAASMSTFDSWVNQTAGLFVRDIYQKHIHPNANVKELMIASWLFIIVLVGTGFVFAFSVKSINDVWGWIIMSLGGGLMIPLLLRFYWWRFNGPGFAVGMIAGMVAAVAQRLVAPHLPEQWEYLASENWSLLILGLIGLAGSVIGSLLTAPTAEPVLRNFYLTTLPFGAWSRFKQELPDGFRSRVSAEHKRDVCAVPFALVFQIMIFLAPMLAVIGNWQAAIICTVLAIIGFVGLYLIWLRRINESDQIANEGCRLAANAKQPDQQVSDFQSN